MENRGPLHVAWIADTERVEAVGIDHGLLVLPDSSAGEPDAHRIYWLAKTPERLAQLLALPLALSLEMGVWPLAAKIVRDNPDSGSSREGVPFPPIETLRWPVSAKSRMLVEAFLTAVAAGARSADGSHVAPIASARSALVEHISKLETLAGRR